MTLMPTNRTTAQQDAQWSSAYENAVDRLFPGATVLTQEQDELCSKEAALEIAQY